MLLADSKSATSPNVARRVDCRNPDIETRGMCEHNLRIFFRLDLDEALNLIFTFSVIKRVFDQQVQHAHLFFCIYIHNHMFISVSLYMNRHKRIHKKTHIHWNTDAQTQPTPPPHPHVPTFLCMNKQIFK